MSEWIKGNTPPFPGLYWVTVNVDGDIKMYDEPFNYMGHGEWKWNGKNYYASNIIACMECNKPKEPYNEKHIGYPEQYYIRIKTDRRGISYYAKGFRSVGWSKIGYSTKERAIAALKRYRREQQKMGYEEEEYAVVNGNGEEIFEFKKKV